MEKKNTYLVIQTAFLGDVLLSFLMMQQLKKSMPNSIIFYVCRAGLKSAVELSGFVDTVFEVKKKDRQSYRSVKQALKMTHFECIFVAHRSFTSLLLASSINADYKIAFKSFFHMFFFKTVIFDKTKADAQRQLSLVEKYLFLKRIVYKTDISLSQNATVDENQFLKLPQFSKDEEVILPLVTNACDLLNKIENKKVISIFPGSVWDTKRWLVERFAELVAILSQEFQIVLLGSEQEKELCESIKGKTLNVCNLAGELTLRQTLGVIQKSALVISNDSGGQHLSALSKTPILTIFGPTILEFGYRAWSNNSYVIQSKKLACRPCGSHGHKICPINTHECMKSITVPQVIESVQKILNS